MLLRGRGRVLMRAMVLVAWMAALSRPGLPHIFYTVSRDDPLLRRVDSSTGATVEALPIQVAGAVVQHGTAAVLDPASGEVLAMVQLDGVAGTTLVRLDTYTGQAEVVGSSGLVFAGLAVDSNGVLWGVTDDAASPAEALCTLDLQTGAATVRLLVGHQDAGEALAFEPISRLLYHASGVGSPRVETIDPITLVRRALPTSGDPVERVTALYWDGETNVFVLGGNRKLVKLNRSGQVVDTGRATDHAVSGFTGMMCLTGCGDCNGDQTGPDAPDVLAAARRAVGMDRGTASGNLCCDVTGDLRITVLDALRLAQLAAGLPAGLDCPRGTM